MSDYNKTASELQQALWSMHLTMVHDARDWAATNRGARLWALLVGWDDDSMREMQRKFGWTDEAVAIIKRRHEAIEEAMGAFPEVMLK